MIRTVNKGYLTENGTVVPATRCVVMFISILRRTVNRISGLQPAGMAWVKAENREIAINYELTRYQHQEGDIYSLSDDNVYCVYEDVAGRIWIATFAGGINYMAHNQVAEIFVNHRNNLKGYPIDYCNKARFITGDDQGHIWIETTVGALMMDADFSNLKM